MKEGDWIEVSHDNDYWEKRIFLRKCIDGVVCISSSYENEYKYKKGEIFGCLPWEYYREIPNIMKLPMTWKEIENLAFQDIWILEDNGMVSSVQCINSKTERVNGFNKQYIIESCKWKYKNVENDWKEFKIQEN